MGKIMYISEDLANQIVTDYKATIIEELHGDLRKLDAKFGDGDVVMARRAALHNFITLLEERNWYRQYTVPEVTELGEFHKGSSEHQTNGELANKELNNAGRS